MGYWILKGSIRNQNVFVILVSYIFYGWWDWRFLSLIIFSSAVDFTIGQLLHEQTNQRKRKGLLLVSLVVNIGLLGVFKYFNFFVGNFVEAFSFFGINFSVSSLSIVLPVGISFYTFQTLSYTIDIYRKKIPATKDLFAFFAFVSFFPQLVAGPIERATNLLPQFLNKRSFNNALSTEGLRQILWGLFKKMVVADNCAPLVNNIFETHETQPGIILIFGAVLFAFQIYCDFSGYSDIAIGTAKLFGFRLMTNFRMPYFSRDIAEFWRRWHISLSTWFRDYLYIPLGGSKNKVVRNVFIIFIVSGFWHGANWTFIVWGALNAIYFLPLLLMKRNRKNKGEIAKNKLFPSFNEFTSILTTFILTCLAWVFFRAENISHAISYLNHLITNSFLTEQNIHWSDYIEVYFFIGLLLGVEWIYRNKEFGLDLSNVKRRPMRWSIYFSISFLILFFAGSQEEFIYFQF